MLHRCAIFVPRCLREIETYVVVILIFGLVLVQDFWWAASLGAAGRSSSRLLGSS